VLTGSDRLLGPRAHQNSYARIPMPINESSTASSGTVQAALDKSGASTPIPP
jgi:hypothetical protein